MSSEGGDNEPNMRLYDVYASRDIGEVGRKYDAWAEDYDNDITGDYGWPAPGHMADVCSATQPKILCSWTRARVPDLRAKRFTGQDFGKSLG